MNLVFLPPALWHTLGHTVLAGVFLEHSTFRVFYLEKMFKLEDFY